MKSPLSEELETLVRSICRTADVRTVAGDWGTVEPSQTRPGGILVTCRPGGVIESLDITPWEPRGYGLVDINLNHELEWRLSDLEPAFGPFEAELPLEGGARRSIADWDDPSLPASALVQAWTDGDRVDSITIRRDPRVRSSRPDSAGQIGDVADRAQRPPHLRGR